MFHWICPECGREIPPAVTECPACDPRALAAEAAKTAPVADAVAPAPPPALPVVEAQAADTKAAAGQVVEPVAEVEAAEPEVAGVKAAEPEVPEVDAAEPEVAEVKAAEPEVAEVKAAAPEVAEVKAVEPEVAEVKAVEPEVAAARAAEPEVTEVKAAEPEVAEVKAVEPEVAEVKAAEPEVAAARAAEPEVTEVKAAAPEVAEVKAVEPEVAEVNAAEPEVAAARAAEPEVTEVKAAAPEVAEVKAVEPEVAEVKAAEAEAAEIKPGEAAATEIKAAEPEVAPVKAAEPEVAEVTATEPEVAEVAAEAAQVQPEQTISGQVNSTETIEAQSAEVTAAGEVKTPPPVSAEPEQPVEPVAEVPMDPLLALAETIYAAQTGRPREKRPEPPRTLAQVAAPQTNERPAAAAKSPVIPTMPAGLADLASAIGINSAPAVEAAPELVPAAAASAYKPTYQGQQALALLPAGEAVALLAPPASAPQPAVAFQSVATPETSNIATLPPPANVSTVPAPPLSAVQTPAVPEPAPTLLQQAVEPSVERPPSGSWLNLAPLQNYKAATRQSLQPATLPSKIVAHDTGPRITLPGPTLPPELVSLQETGVVTVLGDPAKQKKTGRAMPGWAVSFLVMMALLVSGIVVVFYFSPISHSSADAKPAPENVEVPTAAAPAAASHSLADMIEVTGFRILVDYNKKSEIHYLVINHSPNELNDMTVFVTLHAAGAKPGQPPLCRFSFRAPSLKPFEVKEMTASIEKLNRSVTLPDWQDLRAEVQVAP